MSHSSALWLAVFLLAGNAFFVGAEFAVISARTSVMSVPLSVTVWGGLSARA